MRVMVIVKATKNSEAGLVPDQEEMMLAMGRYNEELIKAGIILSGDGLHPSSKGRRIHIDGAKRTVVDGPFSETKELVAGFWIWQVKDIDEATAWARRCPEPMPGEAAVLEIRPVFEAADFAELDPAGKVRAQDEELRKLLEARTK
jgi:hypothetical protein